MATRKDQKLHDGVIANSLDLLRLGAGSQKVILKEFIGMERDIVKILKLGSDITPFQKQRLNTLLAEIRVTTKEYYDNIEEKATEEALGVATATSKATAATITIAFERRLEAVLPTETVLNLLGSNAMVQGAPISAWWAKQSADSAFRFQSVVRRGMMSGLANGAIISAVKTEMGIARRHAAALVQTSVQTISNEARLKTFQENDDILKGLEWVATLDGHTCMQCAPLDGLQWTFAGKAIGGHGLPFRNPPIHFNDRCVLVPITKTFKELGIDMPELPPITRASAQGPIGGNVKFNDFLERMGPKFQDDVLGPGRAKLWRDGKITLLDLINGQGRQLKIAELMEKI